ncbi:MAG: arginine--tRNA ligase [Deltaproteobacteria bacterium]|jgi:arginyl-tRNA synthetase|nr:arginine--tRNA ligase [Deltaproteobacteria bacterium]
MLKDRIKDLVSAALENVLVKKDLKGKVKEKVFVVEKPANASFGHFSTNVAMVYSKDFKDLYKGKSSAYGLASELIEDLKANKDLFDSVEIAGPGFINFRVTNSEWYKILALIRQADQNWGKEGPKDKKIQVEFVSSNPTGPLHVGHGRGAAWGDATSNILSFLGYSVQREYYINDAGNQINSLGASVLFRLKNAPDTPMPDGLYKGSYILEIANTLSQKHTEDYFKLPASELIADLSREAANIILEDMKNDLDNFGVTFDNWFSERSLYENGEVERSINTLKEKGYTYEKDGALFFRSTDFGDDKDRVLIKSDGDTTYFASDVAYHANKFQRGFDLAIDVLGADHGGYQGRIAAVVEALGYSRDRVKIVLYQLVKLMRGKEIVKMSTRAGEFIPLKVVLDEVTPDAARFMYLSQSHDSALDFDLELAKAKNNDNPVFYVQYLCARIFQLCKKAQPILQGDSSQPDFSLLSEDVELSLIQQLETFPYMLRSSGTNLAPHLVTVWLMETSKLFHHYYGEHRMILEKDLALTRARVALAATVRQVVGLGLTLLGISVPEHME